MSTEDDGADANDQRWAFNLLAYKDYCHLVPYIERPKHAPKRLTGSFPDLIPGWLGALPAEVLGAIVDALLTLRPSLLSWNGPAASSARSLRRFMLTCRGASSAVSRAQLLEAIARFHLRLNLAPGTEPTVNSYYALNMAHLRSVMELTATLCAMRWQILHCASLTTGCCRYAREKYNRDMIAHYPADPDTERGRCALEAMGPGRARMGVAVAGGKDAHLVCRTDRGAVIYKRYSMLMCVEAGTPTVYSPDSELVVTFRLDLAPGRDTVLMAASAGDLLVALIAPGTGELTSFGNDLQLKTWDLKTNAQIDVRGTDFVGNLWVCNDTVYRIHIKPQMPSDALHRAHIHSFKPRAVGTSDWNDRHWSPDWLIYHPWNSSVARYTGDVLLVHRCQSGDVEIDEILLFKACTQKAHLVRMSGRLCTTVAGPSQVELSPAGDAFVYFARTHKEPWIGVFEGSNDRWVQTHRVAHFDQPTGFGSWSPCGGILCILHKTSSTARCTIVDLRAARKAWKACKVLQIDCFDLPAWCMSTHITWSNDGIYLQTASNSGVLRIGSV